MQCWVWQTFQQAREESWILDSVNLRRWTQAIQRPLRLHFPVSPCDYWKSMETCITNHLLFSFSIVDTSCEFYVNMFNAANEASLLWVYVVMLSILIHFLCVFLEDVCFWWLMSWPAFSIFCILSIGFVNLILMGKNITGLQDRGNVSHNF